MNNSWQKDYMNNRAAEVAKTRIKDDVINQTAIKFYNAAYQKYKIDKSLDNKAIFYKPYISELYDIVKDSPEFSNIVRSNISDYKIDGYPDIIYQTQLQDVLNTLYTAYTDKEELKSNIIGGIIFFSCAFFVSFIIWNFIK